MVHNLLSQLRNYLSPHNVVLLAILVAITIASISVTSSPVVYAQENTTTTGRLTCQDVLEYNKCVSEASKECDKEPANSRGECMDGIVRKYTPKYSNTSCNVKINKDKCSKEYKTKCSKLTGENHDRCMNTAIGKYKNVTTACTNKQNPQACHKAVVDKCGNDLPVGTNVPQSRVNCIDRVIGEFDNVTHPNATGSAKAGEGTLNFGGGKSPGEYYCGNGDRKVRVKFNIGCMGDKYTRTALNPIQDMLYAFIRFMTIGVGVAVIIAIIAAGVRYSTSQGNAEVTESAKNNIQNAVIALIVYVFIFAIIQYLVPGGLFDQAVWINPEANLILKGFMAR